MGILVVDDEADIRHMITVFLKKSNREVITVGTFSEAKEMLISHNFDLHFLDLNLPDGTGFDLIPFVRKKYNYSRIIVMSAYHNESEMIRAQELGADMFLKKPFSKVQVLNAVNNFLSE